MAKLNNYIISTDYDSLKIIKHQEFNLTVPSITIQNNQSGVTYSFNFTVEPGVYFEAISAECSEYPNQILTGNSVLQFSVPYDLNNSFIEYAVTAYKDSPTNFHVSVSVSRAWRPGAPSSTTTRAVQIKIKVNLLVPSEQQ